MICEMSVIFLSKSSGKIWPRALLWIWFFLEFNFFCSDFFFKSKTKKEHKKKYKNSYFCVDVVLAVATQKAAATFFPCDVFTTIRTEVMLRFDFLHLDLGNQPAV
jgi:hypothetical protein